MEPIIKIMRTPSAFVLLLAAIISLIGIFIKGKFDENIARIPIDATLTAEAKLTQFANTIIPTVVTATQDLTQNSYFQTAEAYPANILTQTVDNPDLNPTLLTFPIISIQDSAIIKDSFIYGWENPDPTFQNYSGPIAYIGSAEKFWSHNSPVVDPPFDITILNTTNETLFVTHLGIEIIKVSYVVRGGGGGGPPSSQALTIQGEYEIQLPDINKLYKTQDGTLQLAYDDLVIDKVYSIKLLNPIYMESQSPYRYVLTLRDYNIKMPTDVFIRLWAKTNKGEARSRIIFLFVPKDYNAPTK